MNGSHAKATAYCPDCGPATIPHWVERLSARLDRFTSFATRPFQLIWSLLNPAFVALKPDRLIPFGASLLAAIGAADILTKPDGKVNWRTRVIWEEAKRRGIVMKEIRFFGLPREFFFATFKNDTRGFDGLPRPRRSSGPSWNRMDDKGAILARFQNEGIPVPRGATCTTLDEARETFRMINGPVIVKPNLGSRSRHTYIHVTNLPALEDAFKKAKELSPFVVIEEELPGFVFRVTLVGGKVAGVMRREPPHVIGDGKHTVRELVEIENKNPLRHGPIFHELVLGREAEGQLALQGLSLNAVPKPNHMVILHDKVSRTFGASTTEITDLHPENHELFEKIARILNDAAVGVDFMIEDISRSWRDQKCGVIECNSQPFIDLHHFPLKGPARNVAGMLWDLVFPDSAPKRS